MQITEDDLSELRTALWRAYEPGDRFDSTRGWLYGAGIFSIKSTTKQIVISVPERPAIRVTIEKKHFERRLDAAIDDLRQQLSREGADP